MTDQQPANDNDRVGWWDQAFPILLGVLILGVAIRVSACRFFLEPLMSGGPYSEMKEAANRGGLSLSDLF